MTHFAPDAFTPAALTIPPDRLRGICRLLAQAHEPRNTIPVLGCARIVAGPQGVAFTITDLDTEITVNSGDLVAPHAMRLCVPFHRLQRVSSTATAPVTFALGHEDVRQKASAPDQLVLTDPSGFEGRINLLFPPEDFPDFKMPDATARAKLGADTLRRVLRLARHCISTEETRYYLNGLFLTRKPGAETLRVVATDGHRMAVIDSADAWPVASIILPRTSIDAIAQMLVLGGDAPVDVQIAEHRAQFTQGEARIRTKLIDGTFPDYTRVIPNGEPKAAVTINGAMLRRVGAMRTERTCRVAFADGRMKLLERHEASASVPAQITGDIGEFGFNLSYLRDQARATPEFRIAGTARMDPFLIHAEDPDAFWILMPMMG